MENNKNHVTGVSEFLILYGRHTPWHNSSIVRSYKDAMSQKTTVGNHWSSTEGYSNNAWNVNFNNGNTNNNNKNNNLTVRPSVAYKTDEWMVLRKTLQVAYRDCCRGKTSSKQCQEYIPIANEDLDVLTTELIEGKYTPSTSTCFLVKYPKWREVFAAAFRDRVIHHWICERLEPLFEQRCISQKNVTHNCRVGFGTNSAVDAVYKSIKYVTNNYHEEAWTFKGDLVGFFMSLDKQRMCDKLLLFIQHNYHKDHKELLLWLTKIVVLHHPEHNCMFNSAPENWSNLPANKSLFRCLPGKGAPIGNLTTQQFANFFMTEFDGWILDKLKQYSQIHEGCKWGYNRFVDDFIINCNDKRFLLSLVHDCYKKLDEMGLKLHKNKRYIQPANHGVMFVGSYIHNGRLYLSNRTLARFKEKVYSYNLYLSLPHNEITTKELEHIRATINSYLGFCQGKQTYRIRKAILYGFCKKHRRYFSHDKDWRKIKLRKRYKTIY